MTSSEARRKYDRIASGYSSRYADPEAIAKRQLQMVREWGARIPKGASVLEIGCADGFVTELLCREGFVVTGLDFSPKMLEVAARRVEDSGHSADFIHADINHLQPPGSWDVCLAVMWTFFSYVVDPARVLMNLRSCTSKKLFVDLNPRSISPDTAVAFLRDSGFAAIESRGMFIPQTVRMGGGGRALLGAAERLPAARALILRKYFNVVLKAEVLQTEV